MSSAVSSRHLSVELGDGVVEGVGSDLFVHVDGISSGEILKDDSVNLDGVSLSLEDLTH